MRASVTNNNGFWTGWLNLLALLYNYNQLWQLTINECLRLAPFLSGLRVSFLLPWLTWFSFTNWSLLQLSQMNTELFYDWLVLLCTAPYTYSLPVTMENVCCLYVVAEKFLPNRCLSMDFGVCSLLRERVFGEPLASNGLPLWLHYSGFQASCHRTLSFSSY
jgi:hypothetical protein